MKTYVLDTNVLIYDPTAIFKFEDNDIIIPIGVIKEIDKIKGEQSERGKNARQTARILDSFRQQGSLLQGVKLPGGGNLSIRIYNDINNSISFDDQILATALHVKDESKNITILVTMDINLRLIAETHNLSTEDYKNQSSDPSKLKNNVRTVEVDFDTTDLFINGGMEVDFPMMANECFVLKLQNGNTILAREKNGKCKGISKHKDIMGISPRNMGQQFAMEFLMDDDIPLVCISGTAGSGKTLSASAVGLHKTIECGEYTKLLISRPIVQLGNDIGFLPGSIEEKISPYMRPIFDNMELILMSKGKKISSLDKLIHDGIVEIEPITYIRGRSLPSQFMIVDEVQNTSPHELKTIITRCGEGTKLVLTGDITQIDSPYMTESTNGLSYVMDRLRNEPMVACIELDVCERSPLAELAANKL